MPNLVGRGKAAAESVARWYASPTGVAVVLLFGASWAASVLLNSDWPLLAATAVLIAVVYPYKLARSSKAISLSERRVLERVGSVERDVRSDVARMSQFVQNERRSYLGAIETARAEWASLISSERLINRSAANRLESQYQAAGERLTELERQLVEARVSLDAVADLRQELKVDLEKSVEATLADYERKLVDLVDGKLSDTERRAVDRVDRRLRSERSSRLLETARLRIHSSAPERLVVIVTPQRTGSTLLTDLLRAHPDGGLWPTAEYFTALGASGRRYPGDLSLDAGTGDVIEVQPGVGGIVPANSGENDWDLSTPRVAVEKIHPVVVDFEPATLIARLDKLAQDGVETTLIYLVRDPVDSIRSFLAYQRRAEKWHADLSSESVVALYHASYLMMEELNTKISGPVVGYPGLRDSVAALVELYREVFGSQVDPEKIASAALAAASAEARKVSQRGPFVDDNRIGVPSRAELLLGWPSIDAAGRQRVEELMSFYQKLESQALNRIE